MDPKKFNLLIKSISSDEISIVKIHRTSLDLQQINELSQALRISQVITQLQLINVKISIDKLFTVIKALENKKSVVSLSIRNTEFDTGTPEDFEEFFPLIVQSIETLENLNHLDLSDSYFHENGIKYLSTALPRMNYLKELILSGCNITISMAPYIAAFIRSNKTLRILDISNHLFRDNELAIILNAILNTNTLSSINLSSGKLYLRAEAVQSLAEFIKSSSSIVELKMDNLLFMNGRADILQLLNALLLNKSLKILSLAGIEIGRHANLIAQWLENNQTIKILNLSSTQISANNTNKQLLFKALLNNSTLECLNLHNNTISPDDEEILAKIIRVNKSLINLNLSGTLLSDKGISLISEYLQTNQSLRTLNISDNRISNTGIQHFAKMLEINKSLMSVNLNGNKFDSQGAELIYLALKKNKHLTSLYLSVKNVKRELRISIQLEVNENIQLRRDVVVFSILLAQARRQHYSCKYEPEETHKNYFSLLPVEILFSIFNLVIEGIEQSEPFLNNSSIFKKAINIINSDESGHKKALELKKGREKQIDFYKKGSRVRTLFTKAEKKEVEDETFQTTAAINNNLL
ncbi:hypothetical protein ACQUW5_10775 [Legionella sp. CNM-1927-20]|uniref:hypothetical protein n=1 Tax=Legionella sp. CNM-1927-20 TaxID=3422221 RepID=UPI00403B183E